MKSIAFYNNKGGVGKTTSVINIAYALSPNATILVIDLDGQGNSTRFFADDNVKPGLEKALVSDVVSPAIARTETRYPNIDIICATSKLNDVVADFSKLTAEQQQRIAKNLISFSDMPWHTSKYDYVLIDMPPALNVITKSVLAACDYVFVPIELGSFAIQGIPTVTDIISASGAKFGGCFVNKYDKDNPSDIGLMEILKSALGNKALSSYIPYSRVVKNAISYGMTAQEYMGWTYATECCTKLANEIKERISE